MGYYLVFIGLRRQADLSLEHALNAGIFNRKDILTLRVPVLLPYQGDRKDFERVDGDLVFHGEHYNAVEKRIFHDTVYTVYTPDPAKNRLYQKIGDWVSLFTNSPLSNNQDPHIWDNLLTEYLPDAFPAYQAPLATGNWLNFPVFEEKLSLRSLMVLLPPPWSSLVSLT